MIGIMIRRILALVPVLTVVGVVVFLLVHLTPGDPAALILGESATPHSVAVLHAQLGLDRPLWSQFLHWSSGVLTGDFGNSIIYGRSVTSTIWTHVGPTASIAAIAFSTSLLLAIPSAIFAVWKRDSFLDPTFMSVSLLGVSIPNFWLALMLISAFSVQLGWLPVAGYVPLTGGFWPWLSHLLLPSFVLSVQQAGLIARMLRDGMLDVLHQDYIRTARSKGVSERVVLTSHALRNALLPTLTVAGTSLAALLGGAIVTEVVFVIPGIGHLVVDSINRRDYPVLQGVVLFIAVIYVVVNLLVDLLYTVLDPRV